LLDSDSKVNFSPILLIDNLDSKASHGCAVGSLDENQLLYLQSRGLSREEASFLLFKTMCTRLLNNATSELRDNILEDLSKYV